MASSKGGLRFVEASKAPSGVDASTTSEFEAAVEVEAAVEAKQATDRFGNPRTRVVTPLKGHPLNFTGRKFITINLRSPSTI